MQAIRKISASKPDFFEKNVKKVRFRGGFYGKKCDFVEKQKIKNAILSEAR